MVVLDLTKVYLLIRTIASVPETSSQVIVWELVFVCVLE